MLYRIHSIRQANADPWRTDPRELDSRERNDGIHDREDEWLALGRGPGSTAVRDGTADDDVRDRDDDWRDERDRQPRDRDCDGGTLDPRDVFMRDVDLPRGPERELVHDRDRDYTLNGSESRTLSAVGTFLQWFFRERQQRHEGPSPPPDERFQSASLAFRAPRFRALFRIWKQDGDSAIWAAQSATLKDALERGEGRVEFVTLTHQYCHLSSLVASADSATVEDDLRDNFAVRGRPHRQQLPVRVENRLFVIDRDLANERQLLVTRGNA